MLLHEGLVRRIKQTGDFISCAAATGEPEWRRRQALYQRIYPQFRGGLSGNLFSILESIGEGDRTASFLVARSYRAEWMETSNNEFLRLAFHWLIISARLGDTCALAELGNLLFDLGEGEAALEPWLIAARRGQCGGLERLALWLIGKDLCLMAPSITEVRRFMENAEHLALETCDNHAGLWLREILLDSKLNIFDPVAAVRLVRRSYASDIGSFDTRVVLLGESGPPLITRPWAFYSHYLSRPPSCHVPEFQFDIAPFSEGVETFNCGIFVSSVEGDSTVAVTRSSDQLLVSV